MLREGFFELEQARMRLTSSGFAVADAVSVDVARILERGAGG